MAEEMTPTGIEPQAEDPFVEEGNDIEGQRQSNQAPAGGTD